MECWIRRPKEKYRRSFSIICRTPSGKTYTLKDERILAINSLYKSGTQDEQVCLKQLEEIRLEYLARPIVLYLDANLDIFHRYWEAIYKDRPSEETSKKSRYNTFKRALGILGKIDLASGTRADFQKALKPVPKSQAWVYAGCYNALLKFIGRTDVTVLAPARPKPIPRHLTLEQIESVVKLLPDEWKLLVWTAFGTGCRFGELFALEKYFNGVVKVEWQRTKTWDRKEPKNKVIRDVPVISQSRPYLQEWMKLDPEIKKDMRKKERGSKILRHACAGALIPEVTIHDLRHSYAIHLLSLGISLTDVARALGDGMAVVQMYYTGFAMSDSQALRLAQGI
jgi:integrase